MKTAALLLLAWTIDRYEPPYAVLIADDGHTIDVRADVLPRGVRPGDRLVTPKGPVVGDADARRRALQLRLDALVSGVDSPLVVRQPRAMRRKPDHYSRRARAEGFAARSIYKIEEIDRRTRLFKSGMRVLDLGAAPGSWLQYISKAVGPKGRVVGVDQREVRAPVPQTVRIVQGDVFETTPESLMGDTGPFHVVVSDMAPSTSGSRFTDHVRSVELCDRALDLSQHVLRAGGSFVCKVFEGEDIPALIGRVRSRFEHLKRIKPRGTRDESVELYVIGLGFKGGEAAAGATSENTTEMIADDDSAGG